jgi:hypothetical protein
MRSFLLILIYFSSISFAAEPEIYSVTYKSGFTFQHFQFRFTLENTKMPIDFPRRRQLDDKAENFNYGQFEVFIPAVFLELPQACKSNYIVRMPQTLDLNQEKFIKEKQDLYYKLKKVASGSLDEYSAVIEITHKNGCNLFFRTAKVRYIDYVGPLK